MATFNSPNSGLNLAALYKGRTVNAAGEAAPGKIPAAPTAAAPAAPEAYTVLQNTKDTSRQKALDEALKGLTAQRTSLNNQYNALQAQANAGQARMAGWNQQEQGAVGGFYDGTMQKRLDALLAQKQAAAAGQANLLRQQAYGADQRLGLQQGGGGSSYRDRILAGAMAKINVDQANADAEQRLKNLQWLSGMQQGLLGQRGAGELSTLNAGFVTPTQRMAIETNLDNRLGNNLANALQNNFYGLSQQYQPNDSINAILAQLLG